ncbi:MAG: lipoate--protein ligase family protein [Phycisphaerae bacterium]|nr:lipoate--protein ligase family protein [Phycisphaerae bacterium]MCZ2401078.1 lipoate--protein ligase family protein [Phycisphaerae bacterium]
MLHVFVDGPCDGPTNMARDEHLLTSLELCPAALRLYGWSTATISLGYFQRYDELSKLDERLRALPVVRRLTGGGAILHDRELTYCLVVDGSLPVAHQAPAALYALAHGVWRDVLAGAGIPTELAPDELPFPSPRTGPFFCFERPGRTDLLLKGGKVLGSAQRRTAGRVLQHGSLLLGRRYDAHPGADLGDPDAASVARWRDAFAGGIARALGLVETPARWTSAALADVETRRAVYAGHAWLRRR